MFLLQILTFVLPEAVAGLPSRAGGRGIVEERSVDVEVEFCGCALKNYPDGVVVNWISVPKGHNFVCYLPVVKRIHFNDESL